MQQKYGNLYIVFLQCATTQPIFRTKCTKAQLRMVKNYANVQISQNFQLVGFY